MEQKQRFVSLAGSGRFTVTELCLGFGISRKTGHKWLKRYGQDGQKGLEERSRAPKNLANRTAEDVERMICAEKRLHPTWGPKRRRKGSVQTL
jgi:transposase-like protein